MDLPEIAIRRPYATAVAFLIAILLGLFALTKLPIDLMPDITYPTLSVSSEYPGVGPEEIETLITRPVEEAVAAVQGLDTITSSSLEGRSQVRLSFAWGTDLDAAAEDLRARLDRIRSRLPDDATPPAVFKFDLAAFPVVFLAVSGDLDPLALKRLAEDQVKPRLERLPGVAAVEVRGGLDREIRVEVDRQRLAGLGLGLDQVIGAVGRESLDAPAGDFRLGDRDLGLRVKAAYTQVGEIADVPIVGRGGQPVRVGDVAKIVDTHQDRRNNVTIDGKPGLQLAVRKQAGTNTVAVAEAVVAEAKAMNADLRGAQVAVTNDTSRFIKRAIDHLTRDLLLGAALAIVVLLAFLRSWRSTLVVATAIPISVIATFGLLHTQGFSLNTMSLGGLALGVGRLVDDAIVVIENIFRRRQLGEDPRTAAREGTREVSLAIIASTATTLAVFVPLIFLSGMTGVMFQQLSLVVVFSLSCSLLVAQGLVPMLAARLPAEKTLGTGFFRPFHDATGRALQAIEDAYARMLGWALAHGKTVAASAAVVTAVAVVGVPWIGTEFMPASDEGEVRVSVEAAPGTALEVLEARFQAIEAIVAREVPEAETLLAEIGGGGMGGGARSGTNTGSLRAILVERRKRDRSSEAIAQSLRRKLSAMPGLAIRVQAAGGNRFLRVGGGEDAGRLTVQIRGYDPAVARRLSEGVEAAMQATPGVADVRVAREVGRPEAVVRVDRARAAALGVSASQVARALEAAVLGSRATYFREGGDEYAVMVRLRPADRRDLAAALDVPIATAAGTPVPLRGLVRVDTGEGPSRIDREGQERVVAVTGEIESRDLGGTVALLRERLRALDVPADFGVVVRGDFEEQQKAFQELVTALAMALLLVYLVMVAQFESLKHPFVILFSVPACAFGVVAALLLTATTLNVQSFIGMIVLTGIAVSNGIVIVDFINHRRDAGAPLDEAVFEGARLRLRPVLMTSLATVLAMAPMALGLGEGGELQAPMARVVIGGLMTSTFITLFLIPVLYRAFNRDAATAAEPRESVPVASGV